MIVTVSVRIAGSVSSSLQRRVCLKDRELASKRNQKIVFLVLDGLGGLPHPKTGRTELEHAYTPNLDRLASISDCGLIYPVAPGVTVGSVVGHLALFGYDPTQISVDRGIIEALGIGFPAKTGDVAARGNFVTLDSDGAIMDRRAGRLESKISNDLCVLLQNNIDISGIEVFIELVKDYRFLLVLRGANLSDKVTFSDPYEKMRPREGKLFPLHVNAKDPEAGYTARLINEFVRQAKVILADRYPANMVVLRGFSQLHRPASMSERYELKSAAIVVYPTYAGIARFLGMDVLPTGSTHKEEIETLRQSFDEDYDFFFVHIKETDSAGEDGDYQRKVSVIEEIDRLVPAILKLKPRVIVVTGDHATPAILRSHSFHPVPVLLYSSGVLPERTVKGFGEEFCKEGTLSFVEGPYGRSSFYVRPAVELMDLILEVREREEMGALDRLARTLKRYLVAPFGYTAYFDTEDLGILYTEFFGKAKESIHIVAGEYTSAIFNNDEVIASIEGALKGGVKVIELIGGPKFDKKSDRLWKLVNDGKVSYWRLRERPSTHFSIVDYRDVRGEHPHPPGSFVRKGYFVSESPSLAVKLLSHFEELKKEAEPVMVIDEVKQD